MNAARHPASERTEPSVVRPALSFWSPRPLPLSGVVNGHGLEETVATTCGTGVPTSRTETPATSGKTCRTVRRRSCVNDGFGQIPEGTATLSVTLPERQRVFVKTCL